MRLCSLWEPFALGGAYLAASHGAAFVRYNTVSAAYFIAAIGVSFVCISISIMLTTIRSRPGAAVIEFFETRGVACLAIVPIHYLLLESLRTVVIHDLSVGRFLAVLIVAIPFCLITGRAFEKAAGGQVRSIPRGTMILIAAALLIAAVLMCVILEHSLWRMSGLFIGQLTICALLTGIDDWLPIRPPCITTPVQVLADSSP
jgi:hypothetical protein